LAAPLEFRAAATELAEARFEPATLLPATTAELPELRVAGFILATLPEALSAT
jgi:hypothetical protein